MLPDKAAKPIAICRAPRVVGSMLTITPRTLQRASSNDLFAASPRAQPPRTGVRPALAVVSCCVTSASTVGDGVAHPAQARPKRMPAPLTTAVNRPLHLFQARRLRSDGGPSTPGRRLETWSNERATVWGKKPRQGRSYQPARQIKRDWACPIPTRSPSSV